MAPSRPKRTRVQRYASEMRSPDPEKRRKALQAFSDQLHYVEAFDDDFARAILGCFSDPDPPARWAALAHIDVIGEKPGGGDETRKAIAAGLFAAISSPDPNDRNAALASIGTFAGFLSEAQRELVVDALIDKAENPPTPSWQSGWAGLSRMAEVVPSSRLLAVFTRAANLKLSSGPNEPTRRAFDVLLPRAIPAFPQETIRWLLALLKGALPISVDSVPYYLHEFQGCLAASDARTLAEGLLSITPPPTNDEQRHRARTCYFALAALHDHLSSRERAWVVARMAEDVEHGATPTTRQYERALDSLANDINEDAAIAFVGGILREARGPLTQSSSLRPERVVSLARSMSPEVRAVLDRSLQGFAEMVDFPRFPLEVQQIRSQWR